MTKSSPKKQAPNNVHVMYEKIKPFLKIENIFLVLFLIFGFIFISITPPGQNPDEPSHMMRAWQLGSGNILSDSSSTQDGKQAIGGMIPNDIVNFFKANNIEHLADPYFKFPKTDVGSLTSFKGNGEEGFQQFIGAAVYSPIAYIHLLPVAFVGSHTDLPLVYTFYLMRIINLLLLALLLFVAIKIIPIGKWVIFVCALLPSTISQGAAISVDGIVIGLTFLFIAYVLKLALSTKKPSLSSLLILFVLISGIVLSKITYAPVALIVILIPILNSQVRGWKNLSLLSLPIVLAAILGIIWLGLTSYIDSTGSPTANSELQTESILSQPQLFTKALLYTFLTRLSLSLVGFFGNFGWLTAPVADIFIVLLCFALILCLFVRSPREAILDTLRPKVLLAFRATLAISAVIVAGFISLSLYLYYTNPGTKYIVGIQGRYFLPLAPLALLAFFGNTLIRQKYAKIAILILVLIGLIGAVMTAYMRYYVVLPK